MSVERGAVRYVAREVFKATPKTVVAGVAAGIVGVGIIVARNHKELTHRNIEIHPLLAKAMDFVQKTTGVGEPTVWAAVHRIHHEDVDSNFSHILKIYRAKKWADKHPKEVEGVVFPDEFKKIAPDIESVPSGVLMQIGEIIDNKMRERLGEEYQEPQGYTQDALKKLFDPDPAEPTYLYPPHERHKGEYTQEQITDILTRDPHSGRLMRARKAVKNGVRRVLRSNVPQYQTPADLFRAGARPDLKPADLQTENDSDPTKVWKHVVGGFVVPSAVVLFARGKYKPRDFVVAAAIGSMWNGVRLGTQIEGGNGVNAIGHPGWLENAKDLVRAIFKKDYVIRPNPDGTYTADPSKLGLLGKGLKILTIDEMDQKAHHERPEDIAHLSNADLEGIDAAVDAPSGSLLTKLAKSKWFPWITEGDNFAGIPKDQRPDMPNEAVRIIVELRKEELKKAA